MDSGLIAVQPVVQHLSCIMLSSKVQWKNPGEKIQDFRAIVTDKNLFFSERAPYRAGFRDRWLLLTRPREKNLG